VKHSNYTIHQTMTKIHHPVILIIALLLISCEPEITEFAPQSGNADFSNYVALGCNHTAGMANYELYKSGQIVSYPNIISRQILHVGGSDFRQPLMRDELGLGKKITLGFLRNCQGDSVVWPVAAGGVPDENNLLSIYADEGPFHNLGLPGAKITSLDLPLNAMSSYLYQYYIRFASSPNASIIDDALSRKPTFFSLWIGMTDILDYALSGGTQNPIIDESDFDRYLNSILARMRSSATAGVIANIPDILKYPFFSHINGEGLWIEDEAGIDGKRQLRKGELVLLTAHDLILCQNYGLENKPLPANLYLSDIQVALIRRKTNEFNAIIRDSAQSQFMAHANISDLIDQIAEGVIYDGLAFNNNYISGGMFSLDGIGFTRRGNAIVANAFIQAINARYRSTIPLVNVTQFQGIEYP